MKKFKPSKKCKIKNEPSITAKHKRYMLLELLLKRFLEYISNVIE